MKCSILIQLQDIEYQQWLFNSLKLINYILIIFFCPNAKIVEIGGKLKEYVTKLLKSINNNELKEIIENCFDNYSEGNTYSHLGLNREIMKNLFPKFKDGLSIPDDLLNEVKNNLKNLRKAILAGEDIDENMIKKLEEKIRGNKFIGKLKSYQK